VCAASASTLKFVPYADLASRRTKENGACAVVGLIASAQAADLPPAQEAEVILRDFRFHTGEALPELRMHYRTVGSPSGEPVLIQHRRMRS
jgi:hypothetical protein